jgi:transcription initiation factor TFIIB
MDPTWLFGSFALNAKTQTLPSWRSSLAATSCAAIVDWCWETVLLTRGANGAYVFLASFRTISTSSDVQTFANDEGDDPSRVGAASDPLLDGIEQLDTTISFKDGGSGIARELQRAASRSQSTRGEKNILSAFRDIASWCDQFSLPKTISDIAKQLYKRADDEKILRGKPYDALIAACIFIACRQAHVPRSFKEICNLTHVSKKALGQCYKVLESQFNLSQPVANGQDAAHASGPEDLLIRYCNHLNLAPRVHSVCREVIIRAREHGVADGRSPVSIAGGAIYFVCILMDEPRTCREISGVAGVSEGTIKLVYKLYYLAKEQLVRQEWIDEGKVKMERLQTDSSKV